MEFIQQDEFITHVFYKHKIYEYLPICMVAMSKCMPGSLPNCNSFAILLDVCDRGCQKSIVKLMNDFSLISTKFTYTAK